MQRVSNACMRLIWRACCSRLGPFLLRSQGRGGVFAIGICIDVCDAGALKGQAAATWGRQPVQSRRSGRLAKGSSQGVLKGGALGPPRAGKAACTAGTAWDLPQHGALSYVETLAC